MILLMLSLDTSWLGVPVIRKCSILGFRACTTVVIGVALKIVMGTSVA